MHLCDLIQQGVVENQSTAKNGIPELEHRKMQEIALCQSLCAESRKLPRRRSRTNVNIEPPTFRISLGARIKEACSIQHSRTRRRKSNCREAHALFLRKMRQGLCSMEIFAAAQGRKALLLGVGLNCQNLGYDFVGR